MEPSPNPQGTGYSDAKPANGIPGQISQEEALKGGEGAKIDPFSAGPMPGPGAPGASTTVGSLLEGKMAVDIMDALIPGLIVVLFHALKVTVKKSAFQLSAKEKDTLAPIVQKCLDSINLNFNSPWTVLAVTLVVFYGSKGIEEGGIAILDKKTNSKQPPVDPGNAQVKRPATNMVVVKDDPKKTAPVAPINPDLAPWTEDHVVLVTKKRKKGPDEARKWLADNWVKKGGVI